MVHPYFQLATIAVLLAAVCSVASTELDVTGHFYEGDDIQREILTLHNTHSMTNFFNEVFDLPPDHPSPVHPYDPAYERAITKHINNPSSRFFVMHETNYGVSLVASPWPIGRDIELGLCRPEDSFICTSSAMAKLSR